MLGWERKRQGSEQSRSCCKTAAGRGRIGPLQVLLHFFGYAVRPPHHCFGFSPLMSSLFSMQPEVQILQSITMTRVGISVGWERDVSARDKLSGDHIGITESQNGRGWKRPLWVI